VGIFLVGVIAGLGGLTLTAREMMDRGRQIPTEHAVSPTNMPIGVGFEVDGVRVTVKSAQWLRQAPAIEQPVAPNGSFRAAREPDRLCLEITLENIAVSRRSVGRGEFRMRAPNGASWAPLADDFPEILLIPGEKLTTRVMFEIAPQTTQLEFVSAKGATVPGIPISEAGIGGIFGVLCRTLPR